MLDAVCKNASISDLLDFRSAGALRSDSGVKSLFFVMAYA